MNQLPTPAEHSRTVTDVAPAPGIKQRKGTGRICAPTSSLLVTLTALAGAVTVLSLPCPRTGGGCQNRVTCTEEIGFRFEPQSLSPPLPIGNFSLLLTLHWPVIPPRSIPRLLLQGTGTSRGDGRTGPGRRVDSRAGGELSTPG